MKKLSIFDKFLIAGCIAVMAYSITGCARKITGNESGTAKMSISIPVASAKLAAITDYATLTITAEDLDSAIVVYLDLIAGTLVGLDVSVPAGLNRVFTIRAFTKDGIVVYSGSVTADITPGLTELIIDLRPTVPMVNLSPHFQQAFFYGDPLGITSQWQDTFEIDIYVHNIDSLRQIDGNVDYTNGPFDYLDFTPGPNLPPNIYFGSEGSYFYVSIYDSIGAPTSLTDENGNAHLATLSFYTYSDWGPDTAQGQMSVGVSHIYSLSGDSLETRDVFTDDAEVLLIRPGVPEFK